MSQGYRFQWQGTPSFHEGCSREYQADLLRITEEQIALGRIRELTKAEAQGRNTVYTFTVGKPDGTRRMVHNFGPLNKHITCPKTSFPSPRSVLANTQRGEWATKVDLKNGYYNMRMHPAVRHLLTYRIGQRFFEYCVVPMGINIAPPAFQELTTAFAAWASRRLGVKISVYLDDFLLRHPDRAKLAWATRRFVRLLVEAGFVVNIKKSALVPAQEQEFLGVIINTISLSTRLTKQKQDDYASAIMKALACARPTIRSLATLRGKLVFANTTTSRPSRFHLAALNHLIGSVSWRSPSARRSWTPEARRELLWWSSEGLQQTRHLHQTQTPPTWVGASDASDTAVGFHWSHQVLHQHWSFHARRTDHITKKELIAADLALRQLPRDTTAHLFVDNQAVQHMLTSGYTPKTELHVILHPLLQTLRQRHINVRFSYITSAQNFIADHLSRTTKRTPERGRIGFPAVSPESKATWRQVCRGASRPGWDGSYDQALQKGRETI